MTLSLLFALLACIHIVLFIASMRLRAGLAECLIRVLLLGLAIDNTILALSSVAFGQDWYQSLGGLRYLIHVLVLPPLVVAGLQLLRRAGVGWARKSVAQALAVGFAVLAIGFGIATEIIGLELRPVTLLEHSRYVSVHALPPFATIVTNLIVLIMAAVLWRRAGWPWLFAGALTIFLINGALGASAFGIVAGNIAEVIFVASWLATLRRLPRMAD